MIELRRGKDRYHFRNDWLSARWSFSFAEYFDPQHVSFGPLRVFNEDTIGPAGGFDPHPHQDMEIVTYVISGALEHGDSMGNHGVIRGGELQRMSAGTGIIHSEYNASKSEPVHLLQIWILPARRGLSPSYEQLTPDRSANSGSFRTVVSPTGEGGSLRIHQDAFFKLASLRPDQGFIHQLDPRRRAYLFTVSSAVDMSGTRLNAGDAARLAEESTIELTAEQPSEVLLLDLP